MMLLGVKTHGNHVVLVHRTKMDLLYCQEGRTPLHYCAASKSPEAVYSILNDTPGVDAQAKDSRGKTASHYMSRPADLKVTHRQKHSGGSRKKSTPSKRRQKVSTPPKREGLNITGANIRIWIHDQDLPKLERIVWEGQGQKLMKETSNIPKVRQFLNLVPRMMIKIKEVHQGVVTGDMEMLETKADQPELLAAKDQNGLNALHKAAALGQVEMCDWIIQRNQSAVFTSDKMGRTPLHYAAIPDDGGETFDTLIKGGADKKHLDRFNKTAEMYRNKPGDLDLSVVYEPIAAPRSGNGTLDIPYSRGASKTPSRAQSRAHSRARPSRSLNVSRRGSAVAVTPRRTKSSERPRKGKGKADDSDLKDLKEEVDDNPGEEEQQDPNVEGDDQNSDLLGPNSDDRTQSASLVHGHGSPDHCNDEQPESDHCSDDHVSVDHHDHDNQGDGDHDNDQDNHGDNDDGSDNHGENDVDQDNSDGSDNGHDNQDDHNNDSDEQLVDKSDHEETEKEIVPEDPSQSYIK